MPGNRLPDLESGSLFVFPGTLVLERFLSRANIKIARVSAPVAQRIEHLPSKQRAAGSSPAGGTIFRAVRKLRKSQQT